MRFHGGYVGNIDDGGQMSPKLIRHKNIRGILCNLFTNTNSYLSHHLHKNMTDFQKMVRSNCFLFLLLSHSADPPEGRSVPAASECRAVTQGMCPR